MESYYLYPFPFVTGYLVHGASWRRNVWEGCKWIRARVWGLRVSEPNILRICQGLTTKPCRAGYRITARVEFKA
jgi:hypothetical protein